MILKLLLYLLIGFGILLILGVLFAFLRWCYVSQFRKQCLKRRIDDPINPIITNIYVGEEKYNAVVRERTGWRFTVEYMDAEGIHMRTVHLNDLYPAW